MRRAVLVLVVAACGDDAVEVAPQIDLPAAGSEADPLPLEEVELSVARAGSPTELVLATFTPGEELVLGGVPFGDDLVVHLAGRTAGVEVAYGRTCGFDLAAGEEPPSPHLWFSRTVHWAAAPAPSQPRAGGGAWATVDGGAAVALGGSSAVEYFDPRAAAWTTVATVADRAGGVVAAFGDGRGVLLGGLGATTYEVVDPIAARVETFDDGRLGLDGLAVATLETGDVIAIGGRDGAGPVDTVFTIEISEGAAPTTRQSPARLALPRSGHTVTRLSSDVGAPVVVIGGRDATGAPVAAAELYRPLRESFSTSFSAPMVVPRSGHAAIRMPDGSVMVVGGLDVDDQPVDTIELFTIDGGFQAVGALPTGAGLLEGALTPLPDGRVLLSGGRPAVGAPPTPNAYVIRLDPLDQTVDVAPTDDLELARAGHTGALLCDGTVLVVGGAAVASADRYNPASVARR